MELIQAQQIKDLEANFERKHLNFELLQFKDSILTRVNFGCKFGYVL